MKSTRVLPIVIALVLLLVGGRGTTQAQGPVPQGSDPEASVSQVFTYQGQLNRNGSPVNGTCNIQFELYDAADGGTQCGDTDTHLAVSVSEGLFTVPDVYFSGLCFTGEARWLQVAVQCTGDAAYIALTPLQALTAAPYAVSLRPGAVVEGSVPTGLHVTGSSSGVWGSSSTTGAGSGVFGNASSSTGSGVHGYSFYRGVWGETASSVTSGVVYGVYGSSASTDGRGVYGTAPFYGVLGAASATTGYNAGVRGESDSTGGWGVAGIANTSTGVNYGVGGVTASEDGYAVYGSNTATTGNAYAVYGVNASTTGRAVYGLNSATTGTNYGVMGVANSPDARGVYGTNNANTGPAVGVRGANLSTEGMAVYGTANATTGVTYGVWGNANSNAGTGVHGQATQAGCSAAFPGNPCSGVSGSSDSGFGVLGTAASGVALGGHATGNALGLVLITEGGGDFISAQQLMPYNRRFLVENDGDVKADGTYTSPAADMAELLPAAAGLEPGDVLVIGADGQLARSTQAYQTTVVGVYSTKPAFLGGAEIEQELNVGKIPLAVVGIVPVKVSAENGPIQPGDLLVASDIPGHAMRAGANPALGTVIGKALAGLDKDTGVILMLVVLQ
jgi:hypothetical protein